MSKMKLSPSQLVTYDFCPRKYYYKYVMGIKEPPSPYLVRGKILHKVLEDFFGDEKLLEGDYDWKEQSDIFKKIIFDLFEREWSKIGTEEYEDCFESEEQKRDFYNETKDYLEFYAIKLGFSLTKKKGELDENDKYYEYELKKHFYPKHREKFLENDEMLGYIDKIVNIYGKGVAIIDIKTSKCRLPNFINDKHLLQLKSYAYMWYQHKGELPKFVGIEYIRSGNSIYYPLKVEDLKEIDKLIKKIKEAKETEIFPKKKQILCDWCFYKDMCFPEKEKKQ